MVSMRSRRLVPRVSLLPRQQEEELEARVVLVNEALEGLDEPVARLMDDHRGHHGWQGGENWLGHAPARLVVPFPCPRATHRTEAWCDV